MTMKPDTAYTELLTTLKRLDRLGSIGGLLSWDESVNMQPASSGLRGEQQGIFTEIYHREASSPRIGELLETLEAEAANLDASQKAVIRDARKDYDRLTRIPAEFAARKAEARTASYKAWVEARKNDDYPHFQPYLEEQLQFAKEEASFLEVPNAYDYWVDQFDPGMTQAIIEPVFAQLLPELSLIVETILAAPDQPKSGIFKGFPIPAQEKFLREVVASLGFDFTRGRIDTAVHPFCGGHPQDTRMTTRFDEDNPLDSLTSSIHETGHALYEQGLPDAFAGTALGDAVGMAFHESQSRMWENQVGRSRAFWNYWEPRYREAFPEQLKAVSSNDLFRAINQVGITPIRVDADEVTYNLHIMLRFELEKGLFDGSIDTRDLPEAWRAASQKMLGYTPKNNREGCLQDIHWSDGLFGYFPSYCLGNLLAAQLWYTILDQLPGLESHFEKGDFTPLLDWLRTHIHSKGRRQFTLAFTKELTGTELSPKFLVRYLKERYLPLYTRS
jgi:carboxypeptidase Taq